MNANPAALHSHASPCTEEAPSTARYEHRILTLIGRWSAPGQEFDLHATIHLDADGRADGRIYWSASRIRGERSGVSGYEWVSGSLAAGTLELRGYAVDQQRGRPGWSLVTDFYRMTLVGDDQAGTFGGGSRNRGDWMATTEGRYHFSCRK